MSSLLYDLFIAYLYAYVGMFWLHLITEVSEARQSIDVTIYEFLIIIIKSSMYALVWPIHALAIIIDRFPDFVLFKKAKPND